MKFGAMTFRPKAKEDGLSKTLEAETLFLRSASAISTYYLVPEPMAGRPATELRSSGANIEFGSTSPRIVDWPM